MTYITPPETDNPIEFVNWVREQFDYPPIEQLVFDGADNSALSCPIALSISKETNLKVHVWTNVTYVWRLDKPFDNGYTRINNPFGVVDWIRDWDRP